MELTLNELSTMTNIPTPTIRRWCLKPVVGEIYNKDVWNIEEVKTQLKRYVEGGSSFNFEIDEIVLVKSKKSTKHNYIKLENLEIGKTYVLHNYSLTHTLKLITVNVVNDQTLYVFADQDKNGYKTYMFEQLNRDNIKFEIAE